MRMNHMTETHSTGKDRTEAHGTGKPRAWTHSTGKPITQAQAETHRTVKQVSETHRAQAALQQHHKRQRLPKTWQHWYASPRPAAYLRYARSNPVSDVWGAYGTPGPLGTAHGSNSTLAVHLWHACDIEEDRGPVSGAWGARGTPIHRIQDSFFFWRVQ